MKQWYESHISALPISTRIRIAILDTGIDTNHPKITGVAATRPGDHPIKSGMSYIGPSSVDSNGHGTQVASLVLRVCPHADIYVAKISEDIHFGNTGQIEKVGLEVRVLPRNVHH